MAKTSTAADKNRPGDKWTFRLALFGSVLSVLTAVFSGFQWWHGEKEAIIKATADLSKQYIVDHDFYDLAVQLSALGNKPAMIDTETKRKAFKWIQYLEYIAFLTNNGLLDEAYLAPELKCDISVVALWLSLQPKNTSFGLITSAIDTLSSRLKCNVFSGPPPILPLPPGALDEAAPANAQPVP